jgi:hypothetical protein
MTDPVPNESTSEAPRTLRPDANGPRTRTARAHPFDVGTAKLQAPLAHGFVADHDATLGHHFLDIAKLRQNRKYGQTQ